MRNAIYRILQAVLLLAVASSFAHADNFMYFKKKAAPAGGGTQFANDTFTDTNGVALQNHTSDSGHTWTQTVGTDNILMDTNRIYASATGDRTFYYTSATSTNANYTVQGDIYAGNNGNTTPALGGRLSTSAATGYGVNYSGGTWHLYKWVADTRTEIGTYTGDSTSYTSYTVILGLNGSSITVTIGGNLRISVTDTDITAAGRAGVISFYSTNQTSTNLDNWIATNAP